MSRERIAAVGLLALLLLLRSRRSSRSDGPSSVVDAVPTGTGSADAFDRARFDAIQRALAAHNAPASTRLKLSRAMLAHMISETGRTNEFNFSVANVMPNAAWRGAVFVYPGRSERGRSYPSLQAGVDDYVNVVTSARYGEYLGQLAAGRIDETQWFERVSLAGYDETPPSAQDLADFRRVLSRVRAEFPR